MAYTTATDIKYILVKLPATITDELLGYYITKADNLINSYLGTRYVVPFTSTPPLVKTISTDIAAYFTLRTTRTVNSINSDERVNERDYLLLHLDSEKQTGTIFDIIQGRTPLLDEDGNIIAYKTNSIQSTTSEYAPIFNLDNVLNWKVDSDQIDNIGDDRK